MPGSIVLIENNEASATAICEILTAAGYHLVWLIESSTAVRQIELLQPHAVIVDWQLLAMDGYEISYYLHHKTRTLHPHSQPMNSTNSTPSLMIIYLNP